MADAPDNDQWLAPRTIDLDNPPPEARLYVELYEREKKEHEALKTEVRTLRDANHQIRLERDHFHEMYNGGLTGNGHHMAQKITKLVEEELVRKGIFKNPPEGPRAA